MLERLTKSENGLQWREKQTHSWTEGSTWINYASVQQGEDLQAKMGNHVNAHRRRVYTNKSIIAVNENYHRVAIKNKK